VFEVSHNGEPPWPLARLPSMAASCIYLLVCMFFGYILAMSHTFSFAVTSQNLCHVPFTFTSPVTQRYSLAYCPVVNLLYCQVATMGLFPCYTTSPQILAHAHICLLNTLPSRPSKATRKTLPTTTSTPIRAHALSGLNDSNYLQPLSQPAFDHSHLSKHHFDLREPHFRS
jgi:hypothetical protein